VRELCSTQKKPWRTKNKGKSERMEKKGHSGFSGRKITATTPGTGTTRVCVIACPTLGARVHLSATTALP
jgi:hypothetical protein